MSFPQESLVSSSQDAFGFHEDIKPISDVSHLVKLLKTNASARQKMGMDMPLCLTLDDKMSSEKQQNFPWLSRFAQLCREAVGSQSISLLENLISVYLRNVTEDVQLCYKKPKRAGKLKNKMNDALKLFHMLYSDIKKPLEYTFYLDKMSDLMAMYIDMEIKASRRSKEAANKISQRLASSLFIFLDNSPDHILDSILKTKFFTKRYKDICIPILMRVLRDSPGRMMYEMTYIRFLLAFKLWKKLVEKKETRIEINKLAIKKLIPPFDFLDKLRSGQFCGVLPYVAKSEKDRITCFLMQTPFNVKEKAEVFLKACRDPKEGMLVVHPAADLGKSFFFSEDIKFSSEPETEVDGSSMSLMNSIWSSMATTDDTGPGDCFRLCNELSLEPKKKKGFKRTKDKNKSIATSPNEKVKKKKKFSEHEYQFTHDVKPKLKETDLLANIKELQEKVDAGYKIKTEKLDDTDCVNDLQFKYDSPLTESPFVTNNRMLEEVRKTIKKDVDAVEDNVGSESITMMEEILKTMKKDVDADENLPISDKTSSTFIDRKAPKIDSVTQIVKPVKVNSENEFGLANKQTNGNAEDCVSMLNPRRKVVENVPCANCTGINENMNCVELVEPVSNKVIDLDSIVEPTVVKTEAVEPCCVVINDDDDDFMNTEPDRIAQESLDVSKITHEVEIGSDTVDVCVPEHIQHDRLDSLLESDIANYPNLHGSDSTKDMQSSVSRDICIGDYSLQSPSFSDGNEDVISQLLLHWPTQGFYKDHDSNLPNVLLRSDINFGILFPEVTIDNDEEDEEIHYQGQGQYARGAKVAFGDMATVDEPDTEWETAEQEYDEPMPPNSGNVSLSPPVAPNNPPMVVEEEPQRLSEEQSSTVAEESLTKPQKKSGNRTTFEINSGFDLSKFQQVSVNLKQVSCDAVDKSSTKGMLTPDPISIHDRTIFQDHYHFMTQQKFRSLYLTKNPPTAIPIPYPFEISPRTRIPVLRCSCTICNGNYMALLSNFERLSRYRNIRLKNEADFKKSQDEELLRSIEESLKNDSKIIKKEKNDSKIISEGDSSLPLKKRRGITHLNFKSEVIDSLSEQGTMNDGMLSKSKQMKNSDLENNWYTSNMKQESNNSVPLMKVVYTSPEGNKLKVKTLAERKEINISKAEEVPENAETKTKKSHKHHRSKRSKQEKRERREQRKLKKLKK